MQISIYRLILIRIEIQNKFVKQFKTNFIPSWSIFSITQQWGLNSYLSPVKHLAIVLVRMKNYLYKCIDAHSKELQYLPSNLFKTKQYFISIRDDKLSMQQTWNNKMIALPSHTN